MSKAKLSPKRHPGNGGNAWIRARCATDPEFARRQAALSAWRYRNDPQYRARRLLQMREYYDCNCEAISAYQREYYQRKRIRILADQRARRKPGFREASTGVGFVMRSGDAE